MKASEWLDRAKQAQGWESDYRAAKELGISRQAVSGYRSGKYTLDEESSLRVAAAVSQPAEIVLLDQMAERAKTDGGRAAIKQALKRLGGAVAGLAAVTVAGLALMPTPASAAAASALPHLGGLTAHLGELLAGLCVMSTIRRIRKRRRISLRSTLSRHPLILAIPQIFPTGFPLSSTVRRTVQN